MAYIAETSDSAVGPAGRAGCAAGTSYVTASGNCYALIGRIGSSAWFPIGASGNLATGATGRLYLALNDDFYADNTGSWTAQITVTP